MKRLGSDSLLYALMNVGTKIIAFIMLPIYTYYLADAETYGMLDYVDRIFSMVTFFVVFGTDSALAFYYFDLKNEEKKKAYVRSVMTFRLLIVLICGIIFLFFGPWLSRILLEDPNLSHLLYLSMIVLAFDTVIALVLTVLRYEFFAKRVVFFSILQMLLLAVFSYLFLKLFSPTIEGILYGRIASVILIFVLLWKPVVKYTRLYWNRTILKELIQYAAPLVPASLSYWVIMNANSMFLKEYASFAEVGIYGAAMKFASMITLLTTGVQMAWRPFSMSLKEKENSPVLFSKIYYAILVLGTAGIMFVATIMPWVIQILDQEFHEAYKYVALLSAVTFLHFYYMIISVGIFFSKKTKIISYAFGLAAVVNIILNFILVPLFSIWGSVAAYMISYFVAIVHIFMKSQKLYYVPVSFGKMTFVFLSTIVLVGAMIFIQEHQFSFLYILLGWLGYAGVIFVSGIVSDLLKGKADIKLLNR